MIVLYSARFFYYRSVRDSSVVFDFSLQISHYHRYLGGLFTTQRVEAKNKERTRIGRQGNHAEQIAAAEARVMACVFDEGTAPPKRRKYPEHRKTPDKPAEKPSLAYVQYAHRRA